MVASRNTDLTSSASSSSPVNIGEIVDCTVEQVMPYGAFVRITKTGRKGMIHISELSYSFVKDINELIHVQDSIKAKIIRIDEKGRIDLSLKQTIEPPVNQTQGRPQRRTQPVNVDREGVSRDFNNRHAQGQTQSHRADFRQPREHREGHEVRESAGQSDMAVFPSFASMSTPGVPDEPDSFEKKMASFLKTSEARIADLNSRNSSRSGRSRRGSRQDKSGY